MILLSYFLDAASGFHQSMGKTFHIRGEGIFNFPYISPDTGYLVKP